MSRSCLLFCDTFYHGHDEEEEVHLDLVGFPKPVHIQEIRVIPHGCRVHTNISEREKVGETSPSSIKVETFVKNLNKPEAIVFEKLGVLDFVEGKCIQLITNSKIATNVMLLRGRYKNLTVALYGDFKNVALELNQVPPPPPPVSEPRIPARVPTHPMVPPHMEPPLQPGHVYGASPRDFEMDPERRERREMEMFNMEANRMGRPWHGKQENDIPDWHIKQEFPREDMSHGQDLPYDHHAKRPKDFETEMLRKEDIRRGKEKTSFKDKVDPRKHKRSEEQGEIDKGQEKSGTATPVPGEFGQVEVKQEAVETATTEQESASNIEDPEKAGSNAGDDLFESLSSEDGEMFDISSKRQGRDEMGYENIESDEEYIDDYDFEDSANLQNLHDLDIYGSDDAWMSVSVSFNPYQCYLAPLESFTSITETKYETLVKEAEKNNEKEEGKSVEAYELVPNEANGHNEDIDEIHAHGSDYENEMTKKLLATLMLNKNVEKCEKWVSLLQDIPSILVQAMASLKAEEPDKEEEVIEILTEWVKHALSYEEAMKLPIAVNIRMLKTGMDLVAGLCQCSTEICQRLISSGIQEALLALLKEEHFASSMKLKCIQALDSITDMPIGMEHILGWDVKEQESLPNTGETKGGKRKEKDSLYEELVEYLLTEQTVRVAMAIKCILRKIHFYEAAANFQTAAESLSGRLPPEQEDAKSDLEEKADENKVVDQEMTEAAPENPIETVTETLKEPVSDLMKEDFDAGLVVDTIVNQQEIDVINGSLEEIFCVIENASELVMQPSSKAFPTSVKLVESTQTVSCNKIYSILASRRFLESMLVVMTSPAFCDPTIYTSLRNLFFHFLQHENGLLFLASDPNTLNGMIRILTQSSDTEPHYSEAPQLSELISDANIRENCTSLHLGLLLIYHLQALQGVDQLLSSSRDGLTHAEMDSEENRSTLHTLYSMTFTAIGKAAVVSVLAQGKNIGCLLPFVLSPDEGGTESKHKRPVSSRYASILLLLTLQNADNMKMLETFGSKLLVCVQKRENDAMLTELSHWVAPLKHIIKLDMNNVSNLVEFIKRYLTRKYQLFQASSFSVVYLAYIRVKSIYNELSRRRGKALVELPVMPYLDSLETLCSELDHFKLNSHHAKGILTSLRILMYITCPPEMQSPVTQKDLTWSQAVIQLFSANALDVFIQLLNKLAEILMGPWRQNQPFSSSHCLVLVTLAVPLLRLINGMLGELISCGTIQFKDTRLLHGLFELHTVLCSLPPAGVLASFIQRLQSKVLQVLLKFTSPVSKMPESEEAVKMTTWYLLVKELFQYTVSTPQAFLSGVVLLSELLPVPFPVHVIEDLTPEEIHHMQTHRMLWMLHLSVLYDELINVFDSLVGSCSQIVHHYLQKVCSQLVDLGLTTAVSTVRLIIDLLLKVNKDDKKEEEEKAAEEEGDAMKRITSNISMRILSLLSYAVSQPGGKAAYLHLTRPSKKGEEAEYPALTKQVLTVLETPTDKSEQIRTIDYVLSLLQSLCDPEICLSEFEEPMTLQHLSNSLPTVETLHTICESLVGHLKLSNQSYASVLQVIRTLVALTDHDVGAQTLKKTLMHHHGCIHELLSRVAASVSSLSVKPPDNEVLPLVSTLLGFIQLLLPSQVPPSTTPDEENAPPEVYPVTNRTVHINYAEMRALLRFTDIESQHSLKQLENALADKAVDDESFEGLLSVVKALIQTLSTEKGTGQEREADIELPPPESIQVLFQRRVLSITTLMGDERMGPSLWLATPDFEDVDPHANMVKCDLEAMAEKYCAGFNLKEEVEKGFIVFSEAEKMKQRKKGKRRLDPLITLKGGHVDDTKRLRLDASFLHQRGRANSRGNWRGRGGGRGVDLFRSRKQNTSRPPSMHVDDFMVMEKHDPAVSGTPQSNKQIMKNGIPTIRGANSEPRPNTAGSFATGHGRWGGPHPAPFRRDIGQNIQPMPPGQRAFDWMMSRGPPVQGTFQQYNRVFPRQSDWNPHMQSPYGRVPREAPYVRSQNRGGGSGGSSGGYWAGPKPKEDNRAFSSDVKLTRTHASLFIDGWQKCGYRSVVAYGAARITKCVFDRATGNRQAAALQRFFPVGTVTGYRQGRGGMGRHMRTCTR